MACFRTWSAQKQPHQAHFTPDFAPGGAQDLQNHNPGFKAACTLIRGSSSRGGRDPFAKATGRSSSIHAASADIQPNNQQPPNNQPQNSFNNVRHRRIHRASNAWNTGATTAPAWHATSSTKTSTKNNSPT